MEEINKYESFLDIKEKKEIVEDEKLIAIKATITYKNINHEFTVRAEPREIYDTKTIPTSQIYSVKISNDTHALCQHEASRIIQIWKKLQEEVFKSLLAKIDDKQCKCNIIKNEKQ